MIEALVALGNALDYVVETEFTVGAREGSKPQVDVAWLAEPDQRSPILIFEVESKPTSGIANNAMKVFSQPSSDFPRPLYFFQVVLDGGNSARIDSLEQTYRTHGYQIINLSQSSPASFLKEILTQHRRLSDTVSLRPLRECLNLGAFEDVGPGALIRILCALNFDADFEPSLAFLALQGDEDLKAFVDWLVDLGGLSQDTGVPGSTYTTYLGWDSAFPLHLGIAAALRPNLAEEMAFRFREWESLTEGRPLFELDFTLNRDWESFLIGGAPVLMTVLGRLCPDLGPELLQSLATMREVLGLYGVPNAIWSLHLAASFGDELAYDAARSFLNSGGGVSRSKMLNPDPFYGTDGDESWPEEVTSGKEIVPDMEAFTYLVRASLPPNVEPSAVRAALSFLVREDYECPWELVAALATL